LTEPFGAVSTIGDTMAESKSSPLDRGDLSGRRALVAGGAGHVGRTVCATLAGLGAAVASVDLEESAAVDAAVVCDLADEAAARAAVREVCERLGGLDVLVHCAALVGTSRLDGWAEPLERQGVDAWRRALDVNLTSAFVLAQEATPELRRSGHGAVVLFSSIYGLVGPVPSLYEGTSMANPAAYGASKAALLQLTRHLAVELAPEVRVNAISPGGIERGQPSDFVERYAARTPLARLATEDDLAGAVAFLATDLSSYVTGHNLVVDGGWTAW
jgi:NAD(P)-dependent dehydrogenase (short-subunit alcohol dehydrogenase family)